MLIKRERTLLEKIYNDISDPGSFSSVERLYDRAKKLHKNFKGTLKDVENFLETQDPFTLHRKVNNRFQRRKVIAKRIDYNWEADLVVLPSLSKFNQGHNYIMTCIDVLSRYAFAVPLKTKSGLDVSRGLRKIFKTHHRQPEKLHTDKGREFYNKQVKALLNSERIVHFSSMSDNKCSLVERFQRTLMTKLHRYFSSSNTFTYTNILDKLIHSYNHRVHRTLGICPAQVTKANEKKIFKHLYGKVLASRKNKPRFRFKIGDLVRISKFKPTFTKGYLKNFTEEFFKVTDCVPSVPVTYRITDLQDILIHGIFYEAQLQRIRLSDQNKAYKIEILKTRKTKAGSNEFLVHYLGWPQSYDQWVSKTQLEKVGGK